MMKFFLFLIFFFPMILSYNYYFWMISGGLVVVNLIFVLENFIFSDYVTLSYDSNLDILSFSLVSLSFWISILMYLSSNGVYSSKLHFFYFGSCVYMLCFILVLTFSSLNLLSFYFFFEASLIPTMLIILGWLKMTSGLHSEGARRAILK